MNKLLNYLDSCGGLKQSIFLARVLGNVTRAVVSTGPLSKYIDCQYTYLKIL